MVIPDDIEKIKRDVHQPIKWSKYDSTKVRENTNCFSHAIGSTVTSCLKCYRLGSLSNQKDTEEKYISSYEVKRLFLDDVKVLQLKVDEIQVSESVFSIINTVSKLELQDNEHIVLLFVNNYSRNGRENIQDFHFIRYDKGKGWSEKRRTRNVYFFEDILKEWPSNWYEQLVGIFKITR